MDFNSLSNKILNGETNITITYDNITYRIEVFSDEFLLEINYGHCYEHHYFDTINSIFYYITKQI
jgi:hypothetical protein